ncbi:hypothetical protein PspLS_07377 [Pyricularia sp. CBS 133598]|nr:hypothetical protein PspLS_07377 [Pyricularia sp. CBS 133598]
MLRPTDLNGCALMSDFVLIGVHGTTQGVWQCGAPRSSHKVPYDLKANPAQGAGPLGILPISGLPRFPIWKGNVMPMLDKED